MTALSNASMVTDPVPTTEETTKPTYGTNHNSENCLITSNQVCDDNSILNKLPIRMISTVVRGYGRGSTDLGIPTANLDLTNETFQSSCPFDDLPTGIYWGYGRIVPSNNTTSSETSSSSSSNRLYKAAISIGYCPTYGNTTKTIEPHFIADENDPRRHASCTGETLLEDFYNQTIRLTVVGYLRPELPFEGLDKLIVAIKNDIQKTEQLGNSTDMLPCTERAWVESMEQVQETK